MDILFILFEQIDHTGFNLPNPRLYCVFEYINPLDPYKTMVHTVLAVFKFKSQETKDQFSEILKSLMVWQRLEYLGVCRLSVKRTRVTR